MEIDLLTNDFSHAYVRYVSPWKGLAAARLHTDKRFVRGEGCYLADERGTRYLDFVSQYGALPFGYNPPRIWRALEQIRLAGEPNVTHSSPMDAAGELAERLIAIATPGLRYVSFANSGTEAAEAAIKLSRAATGRPGILSTTNGFHGMTLGALSASGHATLQQPFHAPAPHFHHVAYGDIHALRSALSRRTDYFAAFIVEPIQGKRGIVDPPDGYLALAQVLCRNAGTLFIVDEVQTGLGRTGRMFACRHEQLEPDVMILAKALGGGLLPIGACLYSQRAYSREFDQWHSSTFAGNSLACRAGLATLDVLSADDEFFIQQVDVNGRYLRAGLDLLRRKHPAWIKSIRGRGYMLGLELNLGRDPGGNAAGSMQPGLSLIQQVESYLLNVEKVRVAASSAAEPTLRLEPPLIAGPQECDWLLAALDRTLEILDHGAGGLLDQPEAPLLSGAGRSERRCSGKSCS